MEPYSLEVAEMHEACLHVPNGHTLRSEIQTDTEIIAIAVILVNTCV